MESKTCISTLSAEDLRLHLLSTNKLPAGIPEKLLGNIYVVGIYFKLNIFCAVCLLVGETLFQNVH
jgi:hypothetical protein